MSVSTWKTLAFASGSAVLCGIAYKVLKKTEMFKRFQKDRESAIDEVLFYGDDVGNRKQTGLDNLSCIYYVITHANRSVEVCMPTLISETIAKCLLDLHQKSDAMIRVVIHKTGLSDQLLLLAEHGIEVKVDSSEKLEHEFILVDTAEGLGHAVAIVGSLDYDFKCVNCNRDNTLMTSDAVLVCAFKREFDRIWDSAVYNIEDTVDIVDDVEIDENE